MSIFIGDPQDVVPRVVRPRLAARSRTGPNEHFKFCRLRAAVRPARPGDTAALRRELGYDRRQAADRRQRRRIGGRHPSAAPHRGQRFASCGRDVPTREHAAGLRPAHRSRRVRAGRRDAVVGYVHDLSRTLACCDLAVVQGGPVDHDGAGREPPAVHLHPAAQPLRAELPRRAPAAALRRAAADRVRRRDAGAAGRADARAPRRRRSATSRSSRAARREPPS